MASTSPSFPTTRLAVLRNPTASPVHAVTFSAGTGQYLLTGSADRAVRLFNPQTARLIQTYAAHGHAVLDLACAADNARFASVGGDKAVFVWDVASAQTTRRFVGHAARVDCVGWGGEEDALLVSGGLDGSVRLWDMRAQGGRAVMMWNDAKDGVTSVAVQGREVYVGSVDGRVRVYDVAMGEVDVDVVAPEKGVTSVVPTKAGDAYLVGALGSVVRLMDRTSGRCLQTFKDEGFQSEEYRVRSTLAMADSVALSGSEDGRIVAWDVLSGRVVARLWHTKDGRDRGSAGKVNKQDVVSAVAWNQLRKQWASAGGDGSVAVWGNNE